MNKVRKVFAALPPLLLWLMISFFFWSWIFNFLTDTAPARKITVFIDEEQVRDAELAAELEKALPGDLRMVKVHPFSYAMLDGEQLKNADIFIVHASGLEDYGEWFLPDAPRGIAVNGAAGAYIAYTEESYLCFGAASLHVAGNPGAVDDAARTIADYFLNIRE